jgi:hypothetical protein
MRELLQFLLIVIPKGRIKRILSYYCIYINGVNQHIFVKNGLDSFVILFHYAFVLQFFVALLDALHVSVHYFAVLLAVAVLNLVNPAATVEFQVEIEDKNGRSHVDKSEAHVVLGLDIDGQVEEVILATKLLIYDVQHIILTKFHWYILDH